MVFDPLLGTVNEFLDYALTIVGVMIIYYIIKFFLLGKSKSDENWKKMGGGLSDFFLFLVSFFSSAVSPFFSAS